MIARWLLYFYKRLHLKVILVVILLICIFNGLINHMEMAKKTRTLIAEHARSGRTRKILLWNRFFGSKDYGFGVGNEPFFATDCPVLDCYVSTDKSWIPVEYYDAIVFHGPQYEPSSKIDYPTRRNPFQWYTFVAMESPSTNPLFPYPEGFFNLTITYRIDSDIHFYYFNFYTLDGAHVSPARDPKWTPRKISEQTKIDYMDIHRQKTKPVAWFVSKCSSPNKREDLADRLSKHLQVDIYGCGPFSCPKSESIKCQEMIRTDYYFYLAFENSNCVDYVTEKVYKAYKNDAIPIVFGGANLTRFLPPNSYIDASQLSVEQIAKRVNHLIDYPEEYAEYFWWRDYYKIGESRTIFCDLCEFLHKDLPPKVYSLRNWWHGDDTKPMCND